MSEAPACGGRSLHWLLHFFVSLVVLSLSGISFGQVLDDFGASGVPGDPGWKEEQRPPYWEAIEQQRQVFAEVFEQGWMLEEMALDLSMPSHDDFMTTGGFTHSGEWFVLDIVLAVPLDYHNEDVPAEIQDQLDAMEFQWSMVIGRLRGPGGDAPIMGSSVTTEYEGEIRHTLSILERMDDQGFDDIELMQLDYYRVAWPACTDGDGNILEPDVLYDTCIETARIEMARERECLMDVMVNGGTVAIFLNTTCWGLNIIGTGGIATPVCIALSTSSIAWFACIMTKAQNLGSAYRAARSCCCNLLNCRVDSEPGGPACPSIATCSLPVDFCGDTPCLPGF